MHVNQVKPLRYSVFALWALMSNMAFGSSLEAEPRKVTTVDERYCIPAYLLRTLGDAPEPDYQHSCPGCALNGNPTEPHPLLDPWVEAYARATQYAHLMAEASMLVYDKGESSTELEAISFFEEEGLRAAVFEPRRAGDELPPLVIAIRGSAHWYNWLHNAGLMVQYSVPPLLKELVKSVCGALARGGAYLQLPPCPHIGHLANGAANALASLAHRAYNQLRVWVEVVHTSYPDRNILVTGHSLGGVLAQAIAIEFHYSGASFCAPGLGDLPSADPSHRSEKLEKYMNSGQVFLDHGIATDFCSLLCRNTDRPHLAQRIGTHLAAQECKPAPSLKLCFPHNLRENASDAPISFKKDHAISLLVEHLRTCPMNPCLTHRRRI